MTTCSACNSTSVSAVRDIPLQSGAVLTVFRCSACGDETTQTTKPAEPVEVWYPWSVAHPLTGKEA